MSQDKPQIMEGPTIKFVTERWGGMNAVHLEIHIPGHDNMMIDVEGDGTFSVHGPLMQLKSLGLNYLNGKVEER